MKIKKFSEWLKIKETGTSTASVAHVPMRLFGGGDIVRRKFGDIKKFGLGGALHMLPVNGKKN